MASRMLRRILRDLALTSALCLGERVLERFLFPGLHRTPGRMAASDPARADDIATLIAEAIALLALMWLFIGTLYIVGWLIRRPLKPLVPALMALVILVLIFANAFATWATLPVTPAP
jgi:hypothetical protein